jgi:membrane protein DedA with SNARE-associated domain
MEETIYGILTHYAYSPWLVYGAICLFMFASAFGLPIPEEVVLIASGFVGHMALNPATYPPPYEGAQSVNVYVLAAVSFFAVTSSDFLIYWIGKRMGPPLFKTKWFSRMVSEKSLVKIQHWMRRYGYWAVLIFRFTPGVRFPGHLMCGAMGLSPWRFVAVDWFAAGFSVPTQVLLVAFYGEYILQYFRQFKIYFIAALILALAAFLIFRWWQQKRELRSASNSDSTPGFPYR